VEFDGRRVVTIDLKGHDDSDAGRFWEPADVSAFLEGPWIVELNTVYAEIAALQEKRNAQQQEESKKKNLHDLKNNFGL
jgi:hypothetical protein